jgi:Uri superfamily endonuclease
LRPAKRRHWHLDYLRSFARPLEIWFSDDPERREHLWASLISRSRGATLPLPGFGSTDCSCPAHLFFFSHTPSFNGFKCRLRHAAPDHGRLYRQTRTTPSL